MELIVQPLISKELCLKVMTYKDTAKEMKHLLEQIAHDLTKAENGNKAASQRVRTGTVRLEKIAKAYRKESIRNEKSSTKSSSHKKAKAHRATSSHKKTHKVKAKAKPKAASHKAKAHKPKAKAHAKPKSHAKPRTAAKNKKPASRSKATSRKTVAKARAFSLKRPTAKLPARKY